MLKGAPRLREGLRLASGPVEIACRGGSGSVLQPFALPDRTAMAALRVSETQSAAIEKAPPSHSNASATKPLWTRFHRTSWYPPGFAGKGPSLLFGPWHLPPVTGQPPPPALLSGAVHHAMLAWALPKSGLTAIGSSENEDG